MIAICFILYIMYCLIEHFFFNGIVAGPCTKVTELRISGRVSCFCKGSPNCFPLKILFSRKRLQELFLSEKKLKAI